jgi:hypothetical protein
MRELNTVRAVFAAAMVAFSCSEQGASKEVETAAFLRETTPVAAEPAPSATPESETRVAATLSADLVVSPPEPAISAEPQPQAPPASRDGDGLEREANAALESGDGVRASAVFSDLLLSAVRSPGGDDRAAFARWSASLARAQRGNRWSKRGPWPSIEAEVQLGDSLTVIRKRVLASNPRLLVCTGLIARANELSDERAIHPKDKLRIPTDRASVLVDLSSLWIFYLHADQVVAAWEVGVGKDGSATQPGTYVVGAKQKEPMWFPVGREPVPFGDPQNPLGTRWLAWYRDGESTSLGFHGTNDPAGIGKRVSEGCIRMRNEDVEALFDILPEGAAVVVQP